MSAPVSRKQARYMAAILYSKKKGTSSRGDRVPDSVAKKYIGSQEEADKAKDDKSDNLPESKGKEHSGGKWTDAHHKAHKDGKKLKKSEIKTHKAAGCLVVNQAGQILLGKRADTGEWATPGGSVDDGEDFKTAALRELKEEANITGEDPEVLIEGDWHGIQSQTFLITLYQGDLKSNGELTMFQWFEPDALPEDMTTYTKEACHKYIKAQAKKGHLKEMMAAEHLHKNINRNGAGVPGDVTYELTHGDALKLVGTGTFRLLREGVRGMDDESIRDIQLDTYTLHIRKHVNDIYSGRITDGHKQIHQFANKSLPAVAGELMSVFEWYLPEDEVALNMIQDEGLGDDAVEGGVSNLLDNYRKHNLANIYDEMETIRQEMRNGAAVDLKEIEQRVLKLFDKLESFAVETANKHNSLSHDVGKAIDEIEIKLARLQDMLDMKSKKPEVVEAFSQAPENPTAVHDAFYPYLTKPSVTITPTGHITISFGNDWNPMEKNNFLADMKAKALKKACDGMIEKSKNKKKKK